MSRQIIVYLLLAASALIVLSFLYYKTQTVDLKRHEKIDHLIQTAKQLDTNINQELIEIRYGLLLHYDSLSKNQIELNAALTALTETLKEFAGNESTIANNLADSKQLLIKKSEQVQDFVSMTAILRNSQLYFPTITRHLKEQLGQNPLLKEEYVNVNELSNSALHYSLTGNHKAYNRTQSLILKLQNIRSHLTPDIKSTIAVTLQHADILINQKSKVDNLLSRLLDIPTNKHFDSLYLSYTKYHNQFLYHADQYRLILSILSVILISYIVYVLTKLNRTTWFLRTTLRDMKRTNRALRVLSDANQSLVRATNESELLNEICNILVKVGEYRLAWVGFAENDDYKTVRPAAQAGLDKGYLDSLKISWADNEQGRGPTGTAIRTGTISVVREILTDPRYQPWREAAHHHGYASSIALPLKTETGVLGALNIYASIQDAFDEKEVELLQELADDLAYGITALRTKNERETLQRQLQQAQKMEAIGQLTGGIAHDFNNILASIMGYTGLALDRYIDSNDTTIKHYLSEVYHSSERARDLIAQILAFSRTDVSERQPIDIQPLVMESIKMLDSTLPSTINVITSIDSDLPYVEIDPVQIQQIILNLCINARDAMDDEGKITISFQHLINVHKVCTSCHEQITGDFVELKICDSGPGIQPDLIARIFEPFYTTKEIGKGSGMGLSIVHGIVHENGGHILVDNLSPKGALFRILLPVSKSKKQEKQEHDDMMIIHDEPLPKQTHILIVDDEASVAGFMEELLESRGYHVIAKTNSQEALSVFKASPDNIDLVITDQTMPELTGGDLATAMLSLRPELPIILCTGYSEHMDEFRAHEIGIRTYLRKPIPSIILLDEVKKLLITADSQELANN